MNDQHLHVCCTTKWQFDRHSVDLVDLARTKQIKKKIRTQLIHFGRAKPNDEREKQIQIANSDKNVQFVSLYPLSQFE